MATPALGQHIRHIDIFNDTESLPVPIQEEIRQIVQANYDNADGQNINEDLPRLRKLLSWNKSSLTR